MYDDLERQALDQMARDGVTHGAVELTRTADVRYGRQSWELEVGVPAGRLGPRSLATVAAEFHERHRQQYGYAMETEELILVNAQVSAIAVLPKPPLGTHDRPGAAGHRTGAMAHDQPGRAPDVARRPMGRGERLRPTRTPAGRCHRGPRDRGAARHDHVPAGSATAPASTRSATS